MNQDQFEEYMAITTGPDGALWFTATFFPSAKIGRVTTGGSFNFFTVASSANGVSAGDTIASGPDGKMWFSSGDLNTDNGSVGNITVS